LPGRLDLNASASCIRPVGWHISIRSRRPRCLYCNVAELIVLDTFGKLYVRGHGLSGYCRGYRRFFDVPMPALIAARGPDSPGCRHEAAAVRRLPWPGGGDTGHGAVDGLELSGTAHQPTPPQQYCTGSL
jgi:hypothetical protein